MNNHEKAKVGVLLMVILMMSLGGCGSVPKPKVKQPVVEVVQQEQQEQQEQLEQLERQRQLEAEQRAAVRAQWKLEAEKRAQAARQRRAEEAKARKRAEEEERRIAEIRRAEEQRKRAEEQRKKAEAAAAHREQAATLFKQVEQSLDTGKVVAAEEQLAAYREFVGERALKQEAYQGLRQKIATMKQVVADMEQAAAAEQYLQQVMDEALVLEHQGEKRAARGKYSEILGLNPQHRGALAAIEQLDRPQKKEDKAAGSTQSKKPVALTDVKRSSEKEQRKKEQRKKAGNKKSSLLGSKAAGWVVQVATYPVDGKRSAYALLGTIKKSGFKAVFIKKQELAGRQLYRVRIGAYGEREEADQVRDRLQQKMIDRGIKVASRVMQQKR